MESKDNRNAILAVVLSGIILFGWNYFFAPQPTVHGVPKENKTDVTDAKTTNGAVAFSQDNQIEQTDISPVVKEIFKFELNDSWIEVDSTLNVINFVYKNTKIDLKENFKFYNNELVVDIDGKKVSPVFSFTKVENNYYKLTDSVSGLSGSVKFVEPGYLDVSLVSTEKFTPNVTLKSKKIVNEDDERKSSSFVYYGDGLEQTMIGEEDSDSSEYRHHWFGLDFNYHLYGFVIDHKKISRIDYSTKGLKFKTLEPSNEFGYKVYFAKKNYDDLVDLGYNLDKAVDFGMWAIIAVPILRGLQFVYSQTHNYGLAIIILTILMRFILFPLQYKSYKSMKKMQVIQPELQKIREKHKENPQKMQQETMALFKKSGANPMSGCLPMLAQMPIFFAFYQVLFTSVELVGAPFYFWISDLSEKDPFYILPILMGAAMFLNMKLTPSTTADPAQQKIMMFMPVIFSLFMLNLPSGLTLYILISTVVAMGQQLLVYRQKTA